MSARDRAMYQARKLAGLCVNCGEPLEPRDLDGVLCRICRRDRSDARTTPGYRAHARVRMRAWRERHVVTEQERAAAVQYDADRRIALTAAGLCQRCKQPSDGRAHCADCRDHRAERERVNRRRARRRARARAAP